MPQAKLLAPLSLLLFLQGCGVTFDDLALDESVPSEIRARSVLKTASVDVLRPQRVLGRAYKLPRNGGGQIFLSTDYLGTLPPDLAPVATSVEISSPVRYESKVTAKVSSKAAYMTFAADVAVDRVMEVVISDSEAYEFESNPTDAELVRYAQTLPIGDGDKVAIITAVVRSTLIYKSYTKTSTNAHLQGGAFGFQGKVATTGSSFASDYILGVNFVIVQKQTNPGAVGAMDTYFVSRPSRKTPPKDLQSLLKKDEDRYLKLKPGTF